MKENRSELVGLPWCRILLLSLFVGCSGPTATENAAAPDGATDSAADVVQTSTDGGVLRLATTTSTRDSGLLDVLVPEFETANGCRVDVIAVGTGAALKLGEAGDVDAVLVHARTAEEAFMEAGHGIRHEPVMHNYFLIAGPADDPAVAKGNDVVAALGKIASEKQRFVSRGDDSGTHKRELSLWKAAGGRPEWDGYVECGQGMGATLVMADEMNAYVLTDEGTWLKQSSRFQLIPLVKGAKELANPYAVMVVNPQKHPAVDAALAGAFADFLISPAAQRMIGDFAVNGQVLFHPDRLAEATAE